MVMQLILFACIVLVSVGLAMAPRAAVYLWNYLGKQAEREAAFLEEQKKII